MESKPYAERLRLSDRVREPAVRQAIEYLALPAGSNGLDAGCGIGQHMVWLAEALGPDGSVTGLDISDENLATARKLAGTGTLSRQLEFRLGDISQMPFEDDLFHWIWCTDTLWPVFVSSDLVATVREFARVTRPGGSVALLYWSSQNLLCGYPALEARLNSAFASTVPYLAHIAPDQHFLGALGWLKAAGLQHCTARSFVAEVCAPLSAELIEAVAFIFSMFWGNLEPHLSERDWADYRRLSDPESEDCVLHRDDYYGFVTYTLFRGVVPAQKRN